MPDRSWKLALKHGDDWYARITLQPKDEEGNPVRYPTESLRVNIKYAFGVDLQGATARTLERRLEIRRFKESDKPALDAYGLDWREPSAYLDEIVADFRYELELALKDVMPWDGEL